jgi:hypothetical protein
MGSTNSCTSGGGSGAPTPSAVAEKLAQQNLGKANSETSDAFRDRVTVEIVKRERARKADQRARRAEKALNKERARADGVKGTGPEGAPAGVDPAAAEVAVVVRPGNEASSKPQDVKEHVGKSNGKAKRKRGQRKRGGQGAKVGPNKHQAAPVAIQGRPAPAQCQQGGPWIPDPDNRPNLLLPREQRKAEVDKRLSGINRPKPTCWDQPPAQAPRRSPPRWDNRRSAPERALDNRRCQRTPSPVDRQPSRGDKKLLGFVAGALELIQERVLRVFNKGRGYRCLEANCLYACTGGSDACACHSPSLSCRRTEFLVDKPHNTARQALS